MRIEGAIRREQLATILQSLLLARPDLVEAFYLVALATGLAELNMQISTVGTRRLEGKK